MPVRASGPRRLALFLIAAGMAACSSDSLTGPTGFSIRSLAISAANGPIVFSHSGGVDIVQPDGSGRVNLHPDGERPSISPDGTKVAFELFTTGGGNRDVWVMDVDGTDLVQLTTNAAFEGYPAWSPDGTKIAYRRQDDGNATGHIWVMNADGSGQTQITDGPVDQKPDDFDPAWSPDGSKIAYTSAQDATPFDYEAVFVVSAGGGGGSKVVGDPGVDAASDPAWSPDGSTIAFECLPHPVLGAGRPIDICAVPAGGGARTVLLDTDDHWEQDPAWSPDGQRIVFARASQFSTSFLWTANADGSGSAELTGPPGAIHESPSWGGIPGATPDCSDGTDNDSDGKADFPADPGCANAGDDDEADPPPAAQCGDGIDNDDDGKTDFPADPGCTSLNDDLESNDPPPVTQCSDGIDNDGDGTIDFLDDLGCGSPTDDTERTPLRTRFAEALCRNAETSDGVGLSFQGGFAVFRGGPGRDVIVGTDGPDVITGGDGNDLICGMEGNDIIHGDGHNDVIFGGSGRDFIHGGHGFDLLFGQDDGDNMFGGAARPDVCVGGFGRDDFDSTCEVQVQ